MDLTVDLESDTGYFNINLKICNVQGIYRTIFVSRKHKW